MYQLDIDVSKTALNRHLSKLAQKFEKSMCKGAESGQHMENDIGQARYSSATLEAGSLMCQGWVRKHIDKSKYLKLKMHPLRYLVLDKKKGQLKMFKPIADVMTECFTTNRIT